MRADIPHCRTARIFIQQAGGEPDVAVSCGQENIGRRSALEQASTDVGAIDQRVQRVIDPLSDVRQCEEGSGSRNVAVAHRLAERLRVELLDAGHKCRPRRSPPPELRQAVHPQV